jgi:phosphoribosylformylglycinamidine synthase
MASGIGATVNQLNGLSPVPVFFGEDQGRYLVTIARERVESFQADRIGDSGIFAPWIGTTGGTELMLGEARAVPVSELRRAHEGWFPAFMAGEPAPELAPAA